MNIRTVEKFTLRLREANEYIIKVMVSDTAKL